MPQPPSPLYIHADSSNISLGDVMTDMVIYKIIQKIVCQRADILGNMLYYETEEQYIDGYLDE